MSRQNKVNPGIYTQRGRLAQDDAARERRKQSVMGPAPTPPPADNRTRLRPAAADGGREAAQNAEAAPATVKAASTAQPKRTTGKAKAGAATKTVRKQTSNKQPATKQTTRQPARKAVLARNAGGPGAAPRATTRRTR
jgi:hypothetical protein